MTPAIPAAASRWPMLVFAEPINSGWSGSRPIAECRTRGLSLDRVAERRPRAMRLQVVDVAGFEARALERVADNPLLGNAVRHRQPARGAVLVDRAAADHGAHLVAVADRVLEPLDDDDAATLAAHISVSGGVECLALAVRREHVGVRERDHGRGREQHVRAACEREVAFAQLQCLARLMDCHQRRTARRVDGDRGTPQAQPKADPPRRRGIRRPDRHVGLDLGVRQLVRCHSEVVVSGQTDEHTGVGVGQIRWRGAGMLHGAPRRLQQEPVLRIHQPDLARRHAEERCVEARHIVDEARAPGDDLAGHTWFRVEEFVDIPAVRGYLRYRVPALAQHVPELIGIRGAWKARCVAHDRETWGRLGRTCGGCHAVVPPCVGGLRFEMRDLARKSTPTKTIARDHVVREASGLGATRVGRL